MTLADLFSKFAVAKTDDDSANADFVAASATKDAAATAKATADAAVATSQTALAGAMVPNAIYTLGGNAFAGLIDGVIEFGALVDPATVTVPDPSPAPAPLG